VTTLAFIDTETTGLDPDHHEVWEVGLILRRDDSRAEYVWQLPVDLSKADPIALNIGRFHDRRGQLGTTSYLPGPDAFDQSGEVSPSGNPIGAKVLHPSNLGWWSGMFARLTWGAHMVGAVPSFDDSRLARLLRRHGACPGWHYHLIDVETLAAGYVLGLDEESGVDDGGEYARVARVLPWSSEDLSRRVGVDPDGFDRHTALADARWAEAIFDKIMSVR
jgi:hypothetical protein